MHSDKPLCLQLCDPINGTGKHLPRDRASALGTDGCAPIAELEDSSLTFSLRIVNHACESRLLALHYFQRYSTMKDKSMLPIAPKSRVSSNGILEPCIKHT